MLLTLVFVASYVSSSSSNLLTPAVQRLITLCDIVARIVTVVPAANKA